MRAAHPAALRSDGAAGLCGARQQRGPHPVAAGTPPRARRASLFAHAHPADQATDGYRLCVAWPHPRAAGRDRCGRRALAEPGLHLAAGQPGARELRVAGGRKGAPARMADCAALNIPKVVADFQIGDGVGVETDTHPKADTHCTDVGAFLYWKRPTLTTSGGAMPEMTPKEVTTHAMVPRRPARACSWMRGGVALPSLPMLPSSTCPSARTTTRLLPADRPVE